MFSSFGPVALFFAACLGHLVLVVGCHNWCYGRFLHKRAGDLIHVSHAAFFLAVPVLAWWYLSFDLSPFFTSQADFTQVVAAGYVILCCGVALGSFPAITFYRLLRPQPAAIVDSRRQVFDVAGHLGYRPTGNGRHRFLAYFPGNDLFRVDLVEHTLRLPRLPAALDGLTILHLSDLHLKGTPDRNFFRAVMDRCAAWGPDLVAVTGDIADSVHHQKWIVPILGRLRWKEAGLAILGNHDYWYDPPFICRRLARIGLQYLGNSWKQLSVRGEPLIVIGHEGPWTRPAPDLSTCPDGPFRLLLSHTPDNIRWARRADVDLMLSGHVHGGQVRIPGIGSVLVPSIYGRKYDHGLFDEEPTLLCVSRGLAGEQPLRLFCRPEVALLTLRCYGPASNTGRCGLEQPGK